MGEMMTEKKSRREKKPSVLLKWRKKVVDFFAWIAAGQPADALCKG
jgi:hypothetical protein